METNQYDKISDNMMVFFPIFRRVVAKIAEKEKAVNPLNSKYPILGVLNKRGILTMSEIGDILGISKPNMTVLVDKLILEKEVKRIYDESDRRTIKIEITDKGKQILKNAKEMLKEELKESFSDISKEEIETLSRSLENIRTIIQKVNQNKIKK